MEEAGLLMAKPFPEWWTLNITRLALPVMV